VVAINSKEGIQCVWQSLSLEGVWSQVVGFVLLRVTDAMNMYAYLIQSAKKRYKYCIFSVICKDLHYIVLLFNTKQFDSHTN